MDKNQRLALLLQSGFLGGAGLNQAGGHTGGFAPPDVAKVTSLPPFQIPGLPGAPLTPGLPPFTAQNPSMPPVTATAQPPPQAQAPLPELPPSLAVASAPGMSQVPQTGPQLEEWRKLMDALQFARQGQ
jgi:hypothetical protein